MPLPKKTHALVYIQQFGEANISFESAIFVIAFSTIFEKSGGAIALLPQWLHGACWVDSSPSRFPSPIVFQLEAIVQLPLLTEKTIDCPPHPQD